MPVKFALIDRVAVDGFKLLQNSTKTANNQGISKAYR